MGMYFKDKTEVYKVRFTPEQAEYIEFMAKMFGCSKSQAVRIIVDSVRMYEPVDVGGIENENK